MSGRIVVGNEANSLNYSVNDFLTKHSDIALQLDQIEFVDSSGLGALVRRPPAPDPRRIASHHDVGLFFGAPDVDALYAHLRAQGIDVKEPAVAPYGMRQLFLRDPDGFVLCFQWRANLE